MLVLVHTVRHSTRIFGLATAILTTLFAVSSVLALDRPRAVTQYVHAVLGWADIVNVADAAPIGAKRVGRNCWVGLSAPAKGMEASLIAELKADAQHTAASGALVLESSVDSSDVLKALRVAP